MKRERRKKSNCGYRSVCVCVCVCVWFMWCVCVCVLRECGLSTQIHMKFIFYFTRLTNIYIISDLCSLLCPEQQSNKTCSHIHVIFNTSSKQWNTAHDSSEQWEYTAEKKRTPNHVECYSAAQQQHDS